jgi:hypothetical protein
MGSCNSHLPLAVIASACIYLFSVPFSHNFTCFFPPLSTLLSVTDYNVSSAFLYPAANNLFSLRFILRHLILSSLFYLIHVSRVYVSVSEVYNSPVVLYLSVTSQPNCRYYYLEQPG